MVGLLSGGDMRRKNNVLCMNMLQVILGNVGKMMVKIARLCSLHTETF